MKPVCIIHKGDDDFDLAPYLTDFKPSRNDLDADGSGRDTLDGYFYRERVAQKAKFTLSFWPLDENEMAMINTFLNDPYLDITYLDPMSNDYRRAEFYASSFDWGTQRARKARDTMGRATIYETEYIGASINIQER